MTTVATSIEALAALEQLQFDVVLVDLRLEAGVQGAVLLSEIAARWPRTRRIAFSASPHLLDDRSLVEAVLEKPWSNEALITLIRGC